MPKIYNNRQLNQMRLEAKHAQPPPVESDVLPYIRQFTLEEIIALIERIVARVAMGKVVQLKPDTAYLAARALHAYNATPSRQSIVREICGVRGGCRPQCVGCIGKANAIMALYQGREGRDER
jgi:hypothetical protein